MTAAPVVRLPDHAAACRALVEQMAGGGIVGRPVVLAVLRHMSPDRRATLLEVLTAADVIGERDALWLRGETRT